MMSDLIDFPLGRLLFAPKQKLTASLSMAWRDEAGILEATVHSRAVNDLEFDGGNEQGAGRVPLA